jgi:hypothetical protein
LDTSFGVRSKDSNRPFVPIKQGQKDITAKAISSWICSTVMLAYKSAGITLPRNQVKAHEVRAISSTLIRTGHKFVGPELGNAGITITPEPFSDNCF